MNHSLILVVCIIFSIRGCIAKSNPVSKIVVNPPTTQVVIINELQDEKFPYKLQLNCSSADTKLGLHYIDFGSSFSWKFKVNFLGTTLFHCYVGYTKDDLYADIYKASRDMSRCQKQCKWVATVDGVFGYTEKGVQDIKFKWSHS